VGCARAVSLGHVLRFRRESEGEIEIFLWSADLLVPEESDCERETMEGFKRGRGLTTEPTTRRDGRKNGKVDVEVDIRVLISDTIIMTIGSTHRGSC
jgi:hypothetical protein